RRSIRPVRSHSGAGVWSDCGHDGQLFQQHDAAGFAGPAVHGQNSRLDGGRQQSVF
ncbi:hypothetical protein pipiens_000874, partial [Culex pipiens pipiens]